MLVEEQWRGWKDEKVKEMRRREESRGRDRRMMNVHDGENDVGLVLNRGEGDGRDHDDHKIEDLVPRVSL